MVVIHKQKPNESSYSEWYKKNRQRISEKRKKLYAGNPEYRERALAASREYREGRIIGPANSEWLSRWSRRRRKWVSVPRPCGNGAERSCFLSRCIRRAASGLLPIRWSC